MVCQYSSRSRSALSSILFASKKYPFDNFENKAATFGCIFLCLIASSSKYLACPLSMSPPSNGPLVEDPLLLNKADLKLLLKLSEFIFSIILKISSGGQFGIVSGY